MQEFYSLQICLTLMTTERRVTKSYADWFELKSRVQKPQFHLVLSSINQLKSDLKFITSLEYLTKQKVWRIVQMFENLKKTSSVFMRTKKAWILYGRRSFQRRVQNFKSFRIPFRLELERKTQSTVQNFPKFKRWVRLFHLSLFKLINLAFETKLRFYALKISRNSLPTLSQMKF